MSEAVLPIETVGRAHSLLLRLLAMILSCKGANLRQQMANPDEFAERSQISAIPPAPCLRTHRVPTSPTMRE